MTYVLKHGKSEKQLLELAYSQRRPLPEFIADAPDLILGLELYFNAFLALENDRSVGMSIGPITWCAMEQYCACYRIEGTQKEDLFYHVRKMDEKYLEILTEKSKSKTPPPVNKTPRRRQK